MERSLRGACLRPILLLLALGPASPARAAAWTPRAVERAGDWVSAVIEFGELVAFRATTAALDAPDVALVIDFTPLDACGAYGFQLQTRGGDVEAESRLFGPHRGAIRVDGLPSHAALVVARTEAGDATYYLGFTLQHPARDGPGLLTELMHGRSVGVRAMLGQSEIRFRFSLGGAGPALRRAWSLCSAYRRLDAAPGGPPEPAPAPGDARL